MTFEQTRAMILYKKGRRLKSIAEEMEQPLGVIREWKLQFHWFRDSSLSVGKRDKWPENARFDEPHMMVSEMELQRESNQMKDSFFKYRQQLLAAI